MSTGVSRRNFLIRGTAFTAFASLVSLGCADDLGPRETWNLWVAKTLRGTVRSLTGNIPVGGARVRFFCGLKPNEFALFGERFTDVLGRYEMVASEHPGAFAGFWRFVIDSSHFRSSSDDVPVYCQILVSKPGFNTDTRDLILYRRPQKTLPPESEGFHLIQNVQLR